MWTRAHQILAAALVVQGGLAAVTWWPSDDGAAEATVLVPLQAEEITSLEVTGKPAGDEEPEPVRLEKRGSDWVITSAYDFPADPTKVSEALDKLAGLEVRRPIATKATSHASLKVAESDYGRKVTLRGGEQAVSLVLGAAASKSVHVRLTDASDVYAVSGFSEWSIGDRPRSYWDAKVVDVPLDEVQSLAIHNTHGRIELAREGGTWTVRAAADEAKALDAAAVDKLAKAALLVRMTEPVAASPAPAHGLDGGSRVAWTSSDGAATTTSGYVIGAELDGSYAHVKLDDSAVVLKVANSALKAVQDATLDALLAPEPPAAPTP